jgi:hypothetical protein
MYMLDIIKFYPFVDGDGGQQDLVDALSTPRYLGRGCKIMAVGQGTGTANASDIQITYTNSDGVAGRMTPNQTLLGTLGAGLLWSNSIQGTALAYNAPFMSLQAEDKGVRSIESINIPTAIGGIFALVVVKPLGMITIQESTVNPHEIDFVRERGQLHEIEDGAYVSMICMASTSASPTFLHAEHTFVWG